jgi:hypothetical protein
MTLHEAIASLAVLPEDAVILAQRIGGAFDPRSPAVLLTLNDNELDQPIREVARRRAPGFDYFLEVLVAREALEGWLKRRKAPVEPPEATRVVIHYATYDAWPER